MKFFGKGFKYIGYINVLYGGYKKVIEGLMYFSPSTKCFYEDVHPSHNIV